MRLQVKNDPVRGTGFALLVVDQAISTPLLSISVFSTFKQLYLGRSVPGRPNWTTAPTERFSAARISGDETSTTYCIGPDITTFIPEGDIVEITSSDGSVREKVAWEGVNIQVTWNGVGAWVAVKDIADGAFRWNWDRGRSPPQQPRGRRKQKTTSWKKKRKTRRRKKKKTGGRPSASPNSNERMRRPNGCKTRPTKQPRWRRRPLPRRGQRNCSAWR